jgi:Uma2 family endonuclease
MREITLPETEPALEWVNGRALQKVSPKRRHSLAQTQFAVALNAWARSGALGMVGTEWRFQVQPPGEERRPLVPDVAFLSYRRVPYEEQQLTEVPRVAPDVVVEVRSPSDLAADVNEKVRVYLKAGALVVFLVDPKKRIVTVCEPAGRRVLHEHDQLTHEALPGFELAIHELFALPRPS